MDVGRREDRFLDHISRLNETRAQAIVGLHSIALKNPTIKDELSKIEELLVPVAD